MATYDIEDLEVEDVEGSEDYMEDNYEEDEYEEVCHYVDMRKLRFRKGVDQYKILEYFKKFKLLVGTE